MAERPYTGFYASFLGGFSLSYEGKRISLTKRLRQKNMQILQILLMAGGREFTGTAWQKWWLVRLKDGKSS